MNPCKGRQAGFTLIEVMVVMAIVAISLGIAGPRIGAGISRLELNHAAQTIRSFVKIARMEAQRSDKGRYVVLDPAKHSIALLGTDMQIAREEILPDSIELILNDPNVQLVTVYVAPSGLLRAQPLRLRNRSGEIEVALR